MKHVIKRIYAMLLILVLCFINAPISSKLFMLYFSMKKQRDLRRKVRENNVRLEGNGEYISKKERGG